MTGDNQLNKAGEQLIGRVVIIMARLTATPQLESKTEAKVKDWLKRTAEEGKNPQLLEEAVLLAKDIENQEEFLASADPAQVIELRSWLNEYLGRH